MLNQWQIRHLKQISDNLEYRDKKHQPPALSAIMRMI